MKMYNLIRYMMLMVIMALPMVAVSAQDKTETKETKETKEKKEKKKKKKPERFSAVAQGVRGPAGGRSVFLNFVINRFTTNDEVMEYANILKNQGQKALRKKLEKVKVGYVSPSGGLGNDIAVARIRRTANGYMATFVMAREIRFFELVRSGRSTDYPFSLFQIEFDKKGKGTGSALISIHLSFNSKNQLVVESLGNQPFRLVNGRHHTAAKSAAMRPKGRIQPASKRKVESLAKK